MGKTLFVSDLDGTLLSSDSRLSPRSVEMLNEAIAGGAMFSVATARTPSTVEPLMGMVKCHIPFVVMTGAAIWDPLSRKFSRSIHLSQKTAEKIIGILRKHDLPTFVYRLTGDKIHVYHIGPLSDKELAFISERTDSPYKIFHINAATGSADQLPTSNVSLFYSMQPSAIVEETYEEIRETVDCNPVFYHDIFGKETGIMEIFSPEASKANAVRTLRDMSGADKIVAFGDNMNDIPMLMAADVAVAVENAVPEVKRIADIIIGANTDDAVPRFILSSL